MQQSKALQHTQQQVLLLLQQVLLLLQSVERISG
jgi:hypothetical protein